MEDVEVEVLEVGKVESVDYDLIVLGAPVRVGRIHPDMVDFVRRNREKLSGVPKALFVVCLFTLLSRGYLKRFRGHFEGDIAAYRVFAGKLGFIGRLDRKYAMEAGKNILASILP
jgi:menaquinone-dependent protoporphyrinogen IX oxidase